MTKKKGDLGGNPNPKNQFEKGDKRLVKHGGYYFLQTGSIPCDQCILKDTCPAYEAGAQCKPILEYQERVISEIMSLPHVQPEDAHAVNLLARELAFQAIVHKWLGQVGPVRQTDKGLDVQPVMKTLWTSINTAARLMDALGLTPASRAKLKLTGKAAESLALGMATAEVVEGSGDGDES